MTKVKVGVIRGGPSSEYDISLKTGGEVLRHLPEKYEALDVLLSKEQEWFLNGFPKKPHQIFEAVDVVFNALHGEFGEDGGVQQVLESFNVPYTGSQIVPSSLAMKKHLARELFSRANIKIPRALLLRADDFFGIDGEDCAKKVFNSMSLPWVVKPASTGSSVGVSICNTFQELVESIENASQYGEVILVEEYIKGKEATCGVLEDFRLARRPVRQSLGEGGSQHLYALPPVEIIPPASSVGGPENTFFDYELKYDGSTREICPSGFDNSTKIMIEEMAKLAHEVLDCRHYSRADFIVSEHGVYLLEVNTLPGLTSESLLPKAAAAAGLEFPQLLDHIIQLALNRS
jgi:D-alanine-D-alanine ligase